MRLFTAILFEEEILDYIESAIAMLRNKTTKGSFTHRENLHLTLNFIGETDRRELVEEAMIRVVEQSTSGAFTLTIGGFGRFKRREGDICYIPVEYNRALWKLQQELVIRLRDHGFDVDNLEYKPHLTLARRVIYKKEIDEKILGSNILSKNIKVKEICLMKSERIQGKLVYTKIYSLPLSK